MKQYDLFSREFKKDPFPTFADLRAHDPVYPHVAPNGLTIWYISRYEDIVAVLKDTDSFVKDGRNVAGAGPPADANNVLQIINENMLFADPPDHTRLRSLVSQAFNPRRIGDIAPRIRAISAELIDGVRPAGRMEFIEAYAYPLPLRVITEMLGVPPSDDERVRRWTAPIIAPGSHGIRNVERKRRLRALVAYLNQMFADRRTSPRDDLVTALVEAEESGDRLSEQELISMVILLLVTGHETVVNMLGNAVLTLLQHPAERELALSDEARLEQAVEEILRFNGPVETSTTRRARRDVTFRGHEIRAGDVIRVVIGSGNHDPDVFDSPELFVPDRPVPAHLSFGRGIHYCLGAPLARLEAKIALQDLFRELPGLRLAVPHEELVWRSGVLLRGLKALPLVWEVQQSS